MVSEGMEHVDPSKPVYVLPLPSGDRLLSQYPVTNYGVEYVVQTEPIVIELNAGIMQRTGFNGLCDTLAI